MEWRCWRCCWPGASGLPAAEDGKDDAGARPRSSPRRGRTPKEALKDAFRQAVQQVVGVAVDAETQVKNDEVIADKVLTYSDGLITKYEEVSKTERKGLVRIKIKATVEP